MLFKRKMCPDFQHPFGTMPKACRNFAEGTGIMPKACQDFREAIGIIPKGSPKSWQPGGIKNRNLFKINHLSTEIITIYLRGRLIL